MCPLEKSKSPSRSLTSRTSPSQDPDISHPMARQTRHHESPSRSSCHHLYSDQKLSGDSDDIQDAEAESASSCTYSLTGSGSAPSANSSFSCVAPAYIAVAPLPVFRGISDECPISHLSRFARVCRANNVFTVDMAARIFPVTLDGEAALWYELVVEPDPSLSWEEIKSMFLRAYQRPEQSREELMALKQGESERSVSFYLRMQWILRKWPDHGVPAKMLTGIFVDGLREELQEWVALQRPSSLEEAFSLARSWEDARRKSNSGGKCGFCEGRHEEKRCEVRKRMREMWARMKREGLVMVSRANSGVRPQPQACACWKHQCWKRSASEVAAEGAPPSPPDAPDC